MKINTGLLALLGVSLLLFCAGCDTVNHTQYKVLGPSRLDGTRLSVSANQQEAVRAVLESVGKQLRFQERTARSIVPNTIASYGEQDKPRPITFVAYVQQGVIVIDIVHAPGEPGESNRYRKVHDLILAGLKEKLPPNTVAVSDRQSRATNVSAPPAEGSRSNGKLTTSDWPTNPPR